jgi:hypothetical protein
MIVDDKAIQEIAKLAQSALTADKLIYVKDLPPDPARRSRELLVVDQDGEQKSVTLGPPPRKTTLDLATLLPYLTTCFERGWKISPTIYVEPERCVVQLYDGEETLDRPDLLVCNLRRSVEWANLHDPGPKPHREFVKWLRLRLARGLSNGSHPNLAKLVAKLQGTSSSQRSSDQTKSRASLGVEIEQEVRGADVDLPEEVELVFPAYEDPLLRSFEVTIRCDLDVDPQNLNCNLVPLAGERYRQSHAAVEHVANVLAVQRDLAFADLMSQQGAGELQPIPIVIGLAPTYVPPTADADDSARD